MKFSRPALFVSLAILVVLIALTVPFLRLGREIGALDSCAGNLHALHRRMEMHFLQQRRTMKIDEPIGKAFWAQLREAAPGDATLECPARETSISPRIDYLGPPRPLARLADSDPLGCDEDLNHGSALKPTGMVLRKAGDVRQVFDSEWRSIFTERKCIP